MARKVTKYVDDDGGLHDTMEQAQQADKELLMKSQLADIAQSINCYNMTSDDLAKELYEYRSSLFNVIIASIIPTLSKEDLESAYCMAKNELHKRGLI